MKELRSVIAAQPECSRPARAQSGALTVLPVLIERHLLTFIVRTPPRVPHVLPDIIRVTPGRPCVWVVCRDSIKGRKMLFNVTIVQWAWFRVLSMLLSAMHAQLRRLKACRRAPRAKLANSVPTAARARADGTNFRQKFPNRALHALQVFTRKITERRSVFRVLLVSFHPKLDASRVIRVPSGNFRRIPKPSPAMIAHKAEKARRQVLHFACRAVLGRTRATWTLVLNVHKVGAKQHQEQKLASRVQSDNLPKASTAA